MSKVWKYLRIDEILGLGFKYGFRGDGGVGDSHRETEVTDWVFCQK